MALPTIAKCQQHLGISLKIFEEDIFVKKLNDKEKDDNEDEIVQNLNDKDEVEDR